jgi:adenine-specific DNA-methyltransferase
MTNVDIIKEFRCQYEKQPNANKKLYTYEDETINHESGESVDYQLDFSRSFIKEIISNYWNNICQQRKVDIPLRETNFPLSTLSWEALRKAGKIGLLVSKMDVINAGYYISSLYTKMMPAERRTSWGVFYTPPAIVNRLIENVTKNGFDWKTGRILDPTCGGGAFLAPLALKMVKESPGKNFSVILEDIEARLKGYEIDCFAAWMSMVFLDAALLDIYIAASHDNEFSPGDDEINQKLLRGVQGNSQSAERRAQSESTIYAVRKTPCAMRLPHGRRRQIKNIVEVRNTLTSAVTNNEFFDLIIGNPPYGKVSLVPYLRESYSRSLYGHANLYGLFMDAALRLSNPGALIALVTSTSYLGGMYFKALRRLFLHEAPPVSMDFIEDRKGVFVEVLQETMITLFKKNKKKTPCININIVKANGSESPVEVKNIGQFVMNPRDNEPWKIPRNEVHLALFENIKKMKCRLENLGYTAITGQLVWNRHKSQLKDDLIENSYPLIWAESIMSDESFRFSYSRKNHKPYFKLQENQAYLLTKEACILVQRTTAKEQRKRIMAAILPGPFVDKYKGVVVENHLNIIKPINGKQVSISLEALKFILNSNALDMVFRSMNGSVAVSAYELKSLPMPDIPQLQVIENMIEQKLTREKLENQLAEFYGVIYLELP